MSPNLNSKNSTIYDEDVDEDMPCCSNAVVRGKEEAFDSSAFTSLYDNIKAYVTGDGDGECDAFIEKEIQSTVENIWELKQQCYGKQLEEALSEQTSGAHRSARYAVRVKKTQKRRTLNALSTTNSTASAQYIITKRRNSKAVVPKANSKDRPILEVIEDIFNLDIYFLFVEVEEEKEKEESREKSKQQKLQNASIESEAALKAQANAGEYARIVCREEHAQQDKPKCFVCNAEQFDTAAAINTATTTTTSVDAFKVKLYKCNTASCGRWFHIPCLKYWPQARTQRAGENNAIVALRCPAHVCHTCVSDDPKNKYQDLKEANAIKCVKCPATYHMDSTCIPAGSQVLSAAHIICPRHAHVSKADQKVNVNWCFICTKGGKLLCCETCPLSVHAECAQITSAPNESYICVECESGRLPLYGEIVWAKYSYFRWWPAIILPPTEVPLNIRSLKHGPNDFVVRFFGSHDHCWISRRRVYLFVDGDWFEEANKKTNRPDKIYLRSLDEVKEIFRNVKRLTEHRDKNNANKNDLQPEPYKTIRTNQAVPPLKLIPNTELISKCECEPNVKNPCAPETDCLNRLLYHECSPNVCAAGDRCQNQMFEMQMYAAALEVFYAKNGCGFGLRCGVSIDVGTFIIEYVGELIDNAEFQRRMQRKLANGDRNFYYLSLERDTIIDAEHKGNKARFINHACEPNCETQKWSVNGLNRIGIFATKYISAKTELTFNYHWDELLTDAKKKKCFCGSQNCSGQIEKISKANTKQKKFTATTANIDPPREPVFKRPPATAKRITKRRLTVPAKFDRFSSFSPMPPPKKKLKNSPPSAPIAVAEEKKKTLNNEK